MKHGFGGNLPTHLRKPQRYVRNSGFRQWEFTELEKQDNLITWVSASIAVATVAILISDMVF